MSSSIAEKQTAYEYRPVPARHAAEFALTQIGSDDERVEFDRHKKKTKRVALFHDTCSQRALLFSLITIN